jgi:hypothetical protein
VRELPPPAGQWAAGEVSGLTPRPEPGPAAECNAAPGPPFSPHRRLAAGISEIPGNTISIPVMGRGPPRIGITG